MLRERIVASVASGQKQTSTSAMNLGEVEVLSADADKIVVASSSGEGQRVEMPLTWKVTKPRELVELARGLLKKQDVDGHLAIAELALRLGVGGDMDDALERLEFAAPEATPRIAAVRDRIAAQAPKPEKKEAPAPVAKPKAPVAKARINHAGRQLPPLPAFNKPILFNTPEADAIVSAMQIFPVTNAWNEDITKRPVHPDSAKIVTAIGEKKIFLVEYGINFVLVPPKQPMIDVAINLTSESDKGPFPFPDNAPIQGWPEFWNPKHESNEVLQKVGEGDRHVILVDPFNNLLYEFFYARLTAKGWTASNMAKWDLTSNKLRPLEWTAADAAGCPMFAGVIRYDEFERGVIEHAMRMTVGKTRPEYIYPATHKAGLSKDPNSPAMGQRFRLKAGYDISKLSKPAKVVATAMKTYGMIVADNGSDWAIVCTPDARIDTNAMRELRAITGGDLEVILTTGENEGPRAQGPAR